MRSKIGVVFIILLLLIGFIRGTAFGSWETPSKVWDNLFGIVIFMFLFLAFVLLIVVIMLREKDIKGVRREGKLTLRELILLVINSIAVAFYFLLIAKLLPYLKSMKNVHEVSGNFTNKTAKIVPLLRSYSYSSSSIVLYIPIVLFLIVFVFLGLSLGREIGESMKSRRTKRELIEFDRKLSDKGLDLFSDPREAIIQLYKKAVLWLEVLGIPYRESWTHWEHAEKVVYKRRAYLELAKLFEKAKYAPQKVTVEDARRAYELYMVIKGEG
ncbi:DUF4129 domain-containing protein [Pyrococcus sp. ST04]|uniref:DUF4129 domain-containing protein n=1 Tax=Pyrococcus sp. ST04 TaxID=1183377 RepID=UPI0002605BC0|nr:DUF4129 domain-containing protein [Pyrococcus sp. ST04]AFK22299.1 hypothetical protein Py04_0697 [Pyrococcus sp. ST04]